MKAAASASLSAKAKAIGWSGEMAAKLAPGFKVLHTVSSASSRKYIDRAWSAESMPLMFGASAVAQLMLGRTLFAEAVSKAGLPDWPISELVAMSEADELAELEVTTGTDQTAD